MSVTPSHTESISSGGFKIPYFGKKSGLTAIRARDVNSFIIDYLNPFGNMSITRGESDAVIYSQGSMVIQLKRTAADSAGAGWSWADPVEYVNATDYLPGNVVIVSPTNASIASCTAGIWVAMLEAGSSHYPLWNPASPSTYWWPLSFYPTTMTVCLDGVDTDYYVNAQPVP